MAEPSRHLYQKGRVFRQSGNTQSCTEVIMKCYSLLFAAIPLSVSCRTAFSHRVTKELVNICAERQQRRATIACWTSLEECFERAVKSVDKKIVTLGYLSR